ncbi:MAG: TIGR02996 domain-containing protein, partial [Planctomycetia bacterium]|nr:TIGR02996 domain-containing protein [Planctomycetia bacterium]
MSDEKALLAAIWEHPHEDTPRLMYADWLEETGTKANVARAEFIRLQCEFARLDEDDLRFRVGRAAANKLAKQWGATWKMGVSRSLRGAKWHRGFLQPDDRGINFAELVQMPTTELYATPTRSFSVMDAASRFDQLLAWPHLARLDKFYLRSGVPAGDWLARAFACHGFRNVCHISLIDCQVTTEQLESLLSAWQDHRIVSLHVSKIGDDGFRMLLAHPILAELRELGVTSCSLTAEAVRALAESNYHPPVPELVLAWNPIGDEGIAELVRWPGLSRIRVLGLNNAQIGDAGAAALAGCESLRSLRKLWLGGNQIGPQGAAALVASPHLKLLTDLYLHDNPLPPDAL